jgi:hypothetical protein
MNLIAPCPLDDDLVNETAQQRLALGLRENLRGPELRQLLANGAERRLQSGRKRRFRRCAGLVALALSRFGLFERFERLVPRAFEFSCDMAMRRIDVTELVRTKVRLLA